MKSSALRFFTRKRIRKLKEKYLVRFSLPFVVLLGAAGLLCYRLIGLVPFGNAENSHAIGSANLGEINDNIVFAPVKALELALLKITENDAYIRLASVATALAAVWLLYLMLRKWYTVRVSLMTSLLYVTSSWFLHSGRLASIDVLYLCALPALLLITLWFLTKQHEYKQPRTGNIQRKSQ